MTLGKMIEISTHFRVPYRIQYNQTICRNGSGTLPAFFTYVIGYIPIVINTFHEGQQKLAKLLWKRWLMRLTEAAGEQGGPRPL